MEITNNCYKHVKIKNQFQNWTQCAPVKLPAMAAWSPKGERPMIAGFIVVRRQSTGPPAVTAGLPGDRLRDIGGASAEKFVICRENRLMAEQSPGGSRQATAGWLYDIVQGQENRPTSYRSRKIGIRQKSSGHRWIYVFLGRRLKCRCLIGRFTSRVNAPFCLVKSMCNSAICHVLHSLDVRSEGISWKISKQFNKFISSQS